MTVKFHDTKLPNGAHRIECSVRDGKGVMRGFTRRTEAKPLFLLGNSYKDALKDETVAKARRVAPGIDA